ADLFSPHVGMGKQGKGAIRAGAICETRSLDMQLAPGALVGGLLIVGEAEFSERSSVDGVYLRGSGAARVLDLLTSGEVLRKKRTTWRLGCRAGSKGRGRQQQERDAGLENPAKRQWFQSSNPRSCRDKILPSVY